MSEATCRRSGAARHTLRRVTGGSTTDPLRLESNDANDRPVRILAVGNMYPPQHAGGYEIAWQQAMRHAWSLGHRVRILTSDHRESKDRLEEDPDVHRTLRWYWDLSRYEFPRYSLVDRLQLERHNAAQLRAHLRSFRPDVVAWWSMGCMSLSMVEQVRRASIPAVFVVHDDWLVYAPGHDAWLRTWRGRRRGRAAPVIERLCAIPTQVELGGPERHVFNSGYTLDHARDAGIPLPSATVIHPGVDQTFLNPLEQRPWQWRLVYIGRIDRQKGVDTALAALAHLPSAATLTVWGAGDEGYINEMQEHAAASGLGERVRFRGFAAGDTLRAAYEDADAVVFPVRWNEPFGLVPLEAMGLGRPVITTARGGTGEFVQDGVNALVFAPDDPVMLAERVMRLADEPELRARLVAAGRETAERFSADRFAADTVREIVGAAHHAPAAARE
jgi:glycogen(starch) synthase